MTATEALEWLNAALAIANVVLATRDAGSGDYAKGAYRMTWSVLFVALACVTRMG